MQDGQQIYTVSGSDFFLGKKGNLNIRFAGVDADAGQREEALVVEVGTWRVTGGTGEYQRWRGGGRWAAVTSAKGGGRNSYWVRWEGLVTG